MKFFTLFLSAILVFSLAGIASAAKKDKSEKGVRGKISTVSADSVVITAGGKKNPTDVTVQVDKDTTVTIDGNKASVSDLKPGMYAEATPSTGTAKSITATTTKPQKNPGQKKPKQAN